MREMGSVNTDRVYWGRTIGPPNTVSAEIPSSKHPRYGKPFGPKHRRASDPKAANTEDETARESKRIEMGFYNFIIYPQTPHFVNHQIGFFQKK